MPQNNYKEMNLMIFPKEVWKDIKGYEGYYKISNIGRVKRLDVVDKNPKYNGHRVIKGGIRKTTIQKSGYKSVMLSKEGNTKRYLVHRLVAEAFIPNPNKYSVVNHIDGNKINNFYLNLEWCTHSYNLKHAHNNNLIKNNDKAIKAMIKKNKKQVICIDNLQIYESLTTISNIFGYSQGYICECCKGNKEKAYGLHWSYVEDLLKKMTYIILK